MQIAEPKNMLDRVALWCAQYLIFAMLACLLVVAALQPDYRGIFLLVALITMGGAWVLAFVLQLVIRRPRPFNEGVRPLMKMLWETPSFPSAHTAISSSLAALFTSGGQWGWAALFWLMALVIGWSRVRVHVHHPGDIAAGIVVGILSVPMLGAVVGLLVR